MVELARVQEKKRERRRERFGVAHDKAWAFNTLKSKIPSTKPTGVVAVHSTPGWPV